VLFATGQLGFGLAESALERGLARRSHAQATLDLLQDVARDGARLLRLAVVHSDARREMPQHAAREGRLSSLKPVSAHLPVPEPAQMKAFARSVALCSCDTFEAALRTGPDAPVARYFCDPAVLAALPRMLGCNAALAFHAATILECTSLCCEPGGGGVMLEDVGANGLTLVSMPRRCEPPRHRRRRMPSRSRLIPGASRSFEGTSDFQQARYGAFDNRRTTVSGTRLVTRRSATLKLERAMLPSPPSARSDQELGFAPELQADEAELARTAAASFKRNLLHNGFPGRLSTRGNLAFAFSPWRD
jgi:hypothetical protein